MNQRDKAVDILSKKLRHKQEEEARNEWILGREELKNNKRKEQIERRLEELARRNEVRIREIKEIEENVLAKVHNDIKKN